MSYLRTNKSSEKENVKIFRDELKDLGVGNPTIIAFVGDAHSIWTRNLKKEYEILEIHPYSNYNSKEKYRQEVKSVLGFE